MEKNLEGNFAEIFKQAMSDMSEGKIEFLGPEDGVVSVTFLDGKVILIDSTWGTGQDELQRIYDWGTGSCVIKDLTPEEKMILETKWQNHYMKH